MFSNISGGLIFAGKTYGEMLFSKVSLEEYVQFFQQKKLDILCLSEVHLESKERSEMVTEIAERLGFSYQASLSVSPSHLDTSKQQGLAIMSRYPIIKQEEFKISSPGLEVDRPNGDHWRMFDKGALRVHLDIEGKVIAIVNFSYFPFHHFARDVTEPEFKDLRQELLTILLGDSGVPTIIMGDFNCKGHLVTKAFPELFVNDVLKQAFDAKTTVIGANDQLDQILYQPQFFSSSDGYAQQNGSDHLAIGASIHLR